MGVSGSLREKSGILSLPTRVTIRDNDDRLGGYPSLLRTGDFSRSIFYKSAYDDEDTIIFGTFENVVYGKQLISGSQYSEDLIATPNFGPTLSGSTRVIKNVSDQGILLWHDKSQIKPFNDSRLYIGTTNFYMSGTSLSLARSFPTPARDKIQIKIDLDTSENKTIARYDDAIREIEPNASTEFQDKVLSGFCYYNFSLNRWEDMAVNDSFVTGRQIYHFFHMMRESTGPNLSRLLDFYETPSENFIYNNFKPYQFKMSNHSANRAESYAELSKLGYDKIGHPTMMGMAPYKYWYAATSSLYLEMKDYVDHPFVLEKAVIEIPVSVRRKNGAKFKTDASTFSSTLKVNGSNRDIDNYVFFMYRQSEDPSATQDQKSLPYKLVDGVPVPNSLRFLVLSSSAAFYNSKTFSSTVASDISLKGLPHSPSFSHDFNMNVSASNSAEGDEGVYNGVLRLEAIPAIPTRQLVGTTRFPVAAGFSTWVGSSAQPRGSVQIQDYWPGSTTALSESLRVVGDLLTTNYEGNARTLYGVGFNPAVGQTRAENLSPESHPLRCQQGFSSDGKTPCVYSSANTYSNVSNVSSQYGYQAKDTKPNIESPYILFPEDKIIFGIDAGISSTETYTTGTIGQVPNKDVFAGSVPDSAINVMSGSKMVIQAGAASVTLFGSLVKNSVEVPYELNQNLTSDAIHEPIMDKVVDQFQIARMGEHNRSYIDRFITGSISLTSASPYTFRGIDAYFTEAGTRKYLSGSTVRSRRFICEEERIYDTILPSFIDFGRRSGFRFSNTGTDILGFIPQVGSSGRVISGSYDRWSGGEIYAFPYHGELLPRVDGEDVYLWISKTTGIAGVKGWLNPRYSEVFCNRLMYQMGYPNFTPPGGALSMIGDRYHKGASALRYGIYGIRRDKTTAVFRYDRYGQFRDMLEQRIDTKFDQNTEKQAKAKDKMSQLPIGEKSGKNSFSPIQIKFVGVDGIVPISPYNTDCTNMSNEATSSLPYFEGEARNIPTNSDCPRIVSIPNIQFAKNSRFLATGQSVNLSSLNNT